MTGGRGHLVHFKISPFVVKARPWNILGCERTKVLDHASRCSLGGGEYSWKKTFKLIAMSWIWGYPDSEPFSQIKSKDAATYGGTWPRGLWFSQDAPVGSFVNSLRKTYGDQSIIYSAAWRLSYSSHCMIRRSTDMCLNDMCVCVWMQHTPQKAISDYVMHTSMNVECADDTLNCSAIILWPVPNPNAMELLNLLKSNVV